MRTITRLLLIVAALAGVYCVAIVVVLGWPATGWIGLLLGLGLAGRRGAVYLTSLGSARFATLKELKAARMLDGKSGLIIGRMRRRFGKDQLIRLSQAVHTAVFAPSGAGKSVSCVIPFLLTNSDRCVVCDIKGELALATAAARERMGHKIIILDPYGVVTE